MTDPDNYAVWWLSQQNCETIGETLPSTVPDYIHHQYNSRYGSPGRGRLWCSDGVDVTVNFENAIPPMAAFEQYGGIVIQSNDALKVAALPGFLTHCDGAYFVLESLIPYRMPFSR